MAETARNTTTGSSSSTTTTTTTTEEEYWCYSCNKRVTVVADVSSSSLSCLECSEGFVETIPPEDQQTTNSPPLSPSSSSSARDFNSHFLHVLRLLAHSDHPHPDDDTEPPPPPPPPDHFPDRDPSDFLRLQIHTSDDVDHSMNRDVLRLRLRDLAANRRNRILDWAEILMGLEDRSINLRLHEDHPDGFDPEDYLDAAGYEALLRDLAESDARRGAPPASQEAILALENLEIKSVEECVDCAVCKDGVGVGEVGKKLPCGHMYHKDCIVPWLGSRNSCPVCRYELETDDLEYERERSMRMKRGDGPSSSSSG